MWRWVSDDLYAGIFIDGRIDFLIIRNGVPTGQRYRDEILKPNVALMLQQS